MSFPLMVGLASVAVFLLAGCGEGTVEVAPRVPAKLEPLEGELEILPEKATVFTETREQVKSLIGLDLRAAVDLPGCRIEPELSAEEMSDYGGSLGVAWAGMEESSREIAFWVRKGTIVDLARRIEATRTVPVPHQDSPGPGRRGPER